MPKSRKSEPKSTDATPSGKPAKPYPDFPLFWHTTGGWSKKIRGKLVYFGRKPPMEALEIYQRDKDDLYAGRTPRTPNEELTVKDLCDFFMDHKDTQLSVGDLTHRTYYDYRSVCKLIVKQFGKHRLVSDLRPDDFTDFRSKLEKGSKKGKDRGPKTVKNLITRIKTVFNFAERDDLIERAIRYGTTFKVPPAKQLRKVRNQQTKKFFEPDEIKLILEHCPTAQLRAMVYLGVNCGFNNSDCGHLPRSAVDLDKGWIDFARVKTEVMRRCPLWPETVAAIREALEETPAPKTDDAEDLVFVTRCGQAWARDDLSGSPISAEFRKIQQAAGIHKHGRGFGSFRHCFQTIGDNSKDFVAVKYIMGHVESSMSDVYREGITDERLQAVVAVVHDWLFPPITTKGKSGKRGKQ